MALAELALRRAGSPDLETFQRDNGLPPDGQAGPLTWQALEPWLTGYRLYAMQPGDSYDLLARRTGVSVRALITANPNLDPLQLRVGQRIVLPLGFDVVPTDEPFSYGLLQFCLQGLTARYPFLGRGTLATTAGGRQVEYLRMGLGPRRVLINAAHHANEWITVPLTLCFLERWARAVSENGDLAGRSAQALYQRCTLTLVPMVNPDGVDLVNGALAPGSADYARALALAADYPDIPFPSGWKANLEGVDLNLQYPAGWEQARQNKFALGYTRPGPRDYVGPAPLTAPESLGLYRLTRQLDPVLTLSYHTQGEVIYWKYQSMEPPGARALGQTLAGASGYRLEDVPFASSFAGYKDWFILAYDRPGYTVEAGRGENPLPLSQLPRLLEENLPLMAAALAGA